MSDWSAALTEELWRVSSWWHTNVQINMSTLWCTVSTVHLAHAVHVITVIILVLMHIILQLFEI